MSCWGRWMAVAFQKSCCLVIVTGSHNPSANAVVAQAKPSPAQPSSALALQDGLLVVAPPWRFTKFCSALPPAQGSWWPLPGIHYFRAYAYSST